MDIALDGIEDVNKDHLQLALLSHSLSTQLALIHTPPEDNKTMLNITLAKEKDSKLSGNLARHGLVNYKMCTKVTIYRFRLLYTRLQGSMACISHPEQVICSIVSLILSRLFVFLKTRGVLFFRKALNQYQLLFRLLFYCKRIRKNLDGAWLWHQSMKELPQVRPLLTKTLLLRQR